MTRPTVLVVDDDEDHRFLTCHQLRRLASSARFDVEEASTGVQALERLAGLVASGHRVLLVTDFRMPHMSGAELIRRARQANPGAPVTHVLLTSLEQAVGLRERVEMGADELLAKPFDVLEASRQLGAVVDRWLAAG